MFNVFIKVLKQSKKYSEALPRILATVGQQSVIGMCQYTASQYARSQPVGAPVSMEPVGRLRYHAMCRERKWRGKKV